MSVEDGYPKKFVAGITGLTPRTIQFYTDEGLVIPDVDDAKGRGKTRLYSALNIYEFILAKHLADYGLRLEKIKKVMSLIRKRFPEARRRKYWLRDSSKERAFLIIYNDASDKMTVNFAVLTEEEVEAGAKLTLDLRQNNNAIVVEFTQLGYEIRGVL